MCVVFYLPTRCPRGQQRFFNLPYPVPNSLRVKPGHPALLLPSQPPRREQRKKGDKRTKEREKGEEEKSRYRSACTYRRTTSNPPQPLKKLEMTSLRRPRAFLFPPHHPGRPPPLVSPLPGTLSNTQPGCPLGTQALPLWPPLSITSVPPVPLGASTRSPFPPFSTAF